MLDHQTCFRVPRLNYCAVRSSTQYSGAVRSERESERERERSNLIRFYGSTCILLEQLVSTWSENVYFTHFYQMFSNNSDGRMLKNIYIWFYIQGLTPTPPLSPWKRKLYAFSRLDQSENIIDRFRSVGLRKLHKKLFRQFLNQIETWNKDFPLDPSRFVQLHNIVL